MIHYTLSNNRLLPIEYLEVAYIESTGTLWIDTEYVMSTNTLFECKTEGHGTFFGYRSTDTATAIGDMMFFFLTSDKLGIRYGKKTLNFSMINPLLIYFSSDKINVNVNGILTKISYRSSYSPKKAYLFTANVDGYYSADLGMYSGKLWYFVILESGVLKRHFVPCYRKSDNKPGLFDIVEKKFYINKGTGEFLVGDEVRSLPSGYLLLEYIESDGNLYIDTGVTANQTTEIECKFYNMYYTTNINNSRINSVFGAAQYYYREAFEFTANNGFTTYGTGGTNSYGLFSVTEGIHTVIKRQEKTYLDGTLKFTSSNTDEFTTPYNVHIFTFKRYGRSISPNLGIKIYYYKHKNNDSLVRDMIPCLQTATGKNGMFDLVNNVFYPSATGANFISGNPIENIIEVENTGILNILPTGLELYDYILSSGTLWIDTGIIANQYPIEFKTNLCFTDNVSNEKDFFGNYNGGNSSNCFVCGKHSRLFYLWGGNGFKAGTVVQNLFYELSYKYNGTTGRTLTVDGTANNSTASNNFISRTDTVGMFSGASNRLYCAASVKMKYSQILINGILIRNFLPCTYYGTPGMWDTVENKFYGNQGTGLFTLGTKIELKEYLYLLGDGNSWINTDFKLTTNSSINTKVLDVSGNSDLRWFGSYGSSNGFAIGYYRSKIRILCSTEYETSIIPSVGVDYNVYLNMLQKILKINNYDFDINNVLCVNATRSAFIFAARYNENAYRPSYNKCYYFKLYDNNQLVRDYVPCSYNGEYGLWDRVEMKFYGNVGTGSFTVGPEVIQTQKNLQLNNIGYSYGIEGQYDKNIYTESDGSKWIRIFHHNNPANVRFDSSDTFTTGVYKDADRWFDMAKCNEVNKWELMIKEKSTSDGALSTYRFIQYINPMTATFNDVARSKVKYISSGAWGGLYKKNASAYLVANNGASSNWWGAIGAWSTHEGGSPGWRGAVVTTGYTDVYLRIDNVCPIYKGCYKLSMTSGLAIPNNGIKAISIWRKGVDPSKKFVMFNGPIRGYEWLASINGNSTGVGGYITSVDYYLDGEPVSKFVSDDKWHHYVFNNISSSSNIPTWYFNIYNHNTGEWDCECYILDLRLYDRVLTDDEIKKLYNMRNV